MRLLAPALLVSLLALVPAIAGEGGDTDLGVAERAQCLVSEDLGARRQAAYDLSKCGRDVIPVAPALAAAIRDEDGYVRQTVAWTLRDVLLHAPDAVPELAKALADDRVQVRRLAASLLPLCFDHVVVARAPLIEALARDPDEEVRGLAAAALRMLPTADVGAAATALVAALEDPSPGVRAAAIDALGYLGCIETIEAATLCLDDPNPRVRTQALHALTPLDVPQGLPPTLAEKAAKLLAEDPDPEARRRAAFLLVRFPGEWETTLPALLVALQDDAYGARIAACVSLQKTGPVDPRIPGALAEQLPLGNDSLSGVAASALAAMGSSAASYLPDLGRVLPHMASVDDRNRVVGAMRQILEAVHEEAEGALRRDAAAAFDGASLHAASVLVRVRGGDPESLGLLVDGLADPRWGSFAIRYLVDLGPLATPAVPRLEEAGRGDGLPAVNANLVLALPGGAPEEAARARLRAILADPEDGRDLAVLRGYQVFLPPTPAVSPLAREVLQGEGLADLRAAAAIVLGRVGPAARDALPVLRAAADDPEYAVAWSARSAIAAITGGGTDSGAKRLTALAEACCTAMPGGSWTCPPRRPGTSSAS